MTMLQVAEENGSPVELYFEDYGSGRPVVLVHGWPLSGRSWENQVPALIAAGYRVITYDRRGFGRSTQTWGGYDYDTLASDLHALVEHLDLREVTLVGFSMGGGEVARFIGRYGTERVRGAVLASAVPPFLYLTDAHPDGALDDAVIGLFHDGLRADRVAFLDDFMRTFFAAGDDTDLVSEVARQHQRDIAAMASPKGTSDCVTSFATTDFRSDLEAFDVPTLVIHGDADAVVPLEVSGRRSHDMIDLSQLVIIEGGPHGINATHPEQFNAALLEFLAG